MVGWCSMGTFNDPCCWGGFGVHLSASTRKFLLFFAFSPFDCVSPTDGKLLRTCNSSRSAHGWWKEVHTTLKISPTYDKNKNNNKRLPSTIASSHLLDHLLEDWRALGRRVHGRDQVLRRAGHQRSGRAVAPDVVGSGLHPSSLHSSPGPTGGGDRGVAGLVNIQKAIENNHL